MCEAVAAFHGDSSPLPGLLPRESDRKHHGVVGAALPRKCDSFVVRRFVGRNGCGFEWAGKCSVLVGTQIV